MYRLKGKSESKLKEYVEQLNALKKKHQSTIDSMIARANVIRNDKQRQKQLDSAEKLRLQYENSTEVKELEELINYEAYLEDNNAEFDISDIPHGLNSDGNVLNLEEFVNFLNIVQKYDNLVYTGSDLSVVETAINNHTTYKMATKARTEALKNKIYSSMWSIGQSIKNNLLQTSPITMGPARDAATNSVSGKYSDYLSNDNPGTRMIQQAQNSIGKKSIGINATGIKVLSSLLSYAHTKLSSGKDILLRHGDKNPVPTGDWLFILNGKNVPFKFTPTLSNINWDAVNRTELELLQRTYTEVPEDVLLTISVLLSASTDNAKELILEKINASPELAGVYIYALIGGIDFKTVADFMTTPEVTAVANYAKSNILYNEDKNKSISSAVTYFTNGITNMQDYIKDFDVFKNILLELNGGKSLDYADSNFPTLVRKANKIWAERNGKGSAVEGRVTNVNIKAFDEDSADLLEEILENTQGKLYRPEIEGTQVERYARALDERLESLRTLNLINIELLGILQSKSSELTLLGQLLSLNQGVKTKLVDRLNYFANINRNVGSKIPGFDFMRFLTDDKYKAYTIEKYESAKDTFNVLDIINTVPHFKAMTWALTVSEVIPSKLTLRAKLVPELLNKVKDAIPETKLLPKHISAVQHYITEVLANKFLDKLSLEVSGLSSFYINSDLTMAPKNKLSLNFRNTDHRMTFKNWVETSFLDNLKAKYPKNSFVKDLSFGFFRSRVTSNAYTLLKLPINLDRDMNELLYSNYLKDFNSIRFEESPNNPNLAIGDVMFLYNLIVNKHKPGDFSLTKIFEDYLNTNNKAEMNELNKHLITNFFDFESSFIFGENKLVNGVDYDIRDLAIRFLPNGGSTVIKDDDGKKYEISKEYDFVEKKSFLKFNKEKIKFKGADNTTDLPFLKGDYEIYNKQELREILSDILRLYQNNNLEIKLTCD